MIAPEDVKIYTYPDFPEFSNDERVGFNFHESYVYLNSSKDNIFYCFQPSRFSFSQANVV